MGTLSVSLFTFSGKWEHLGVWFSLQSSPHCYGSARETSHRFQVLVSLLGPVFWQMSPALELDHERHVEGMRGLSPRAVSRGGKFSALRFSANRSLYPRDGHPVPLYVTATAQAASWKVKDDGNDRLALSGAGSTGWGRKDFSVFWPLGQAHGASGSRASYVDNRRAVSFQKHKNLHQ